MPTRLSALLLFCVFCATGRPLSAGEDVAAQVEAGLKEAGAYGGSSYHLADPISVRRLVADFVVPGLVSVSDSSRG